MKQWFKNNRNGRIPRVRETAWERAREQERLLCKHFCMPFEKFMSMKQTKADQTTPSNHANAYSKVSTTHTSNHFSNQLTFLPKAPSWDHLWRKIYIYQIFLIVISFFCFHLPSLALSGLHKSVRRNSGRSLKFFGLRHHYRQRDWLEQAVLCLHPEMTTFSLFLLSFSLCI